MVQQVQPFLLATWLQTHHFKWTFGMVVHQPIQVGHILEQT
jgi:hypothetical protein